MRRLLLVVVLLAAPLAGILPTVAGQSAGFSVLTIIDSALASPARRFEAFDTASLNLADLNGDGRLEVVSQNDNNRVYVIDPATGAVMFEHLTHHPCGDGCWNARELNGVAIGDVLGSGKPQLAVTNSAGYLTLLELDTANWTDPMRLAFREVWRENVSAAHRTPDFWEKHPWLDRGNASFGADGHAFIARVGGEMRIFVQSDGLPGQFSFRADGSLAWMNTWWDGNSGPWVGPLVDKGPVMAVFTSDGGTVAAYDAKAGWVKWAVDAKRHNATPGSIPVAAAVYDLDGDGRKEVFAGARVAVNNSTTPEDTSWMRSQHAKYFLINSDGSIRWARQYDFGHPLLYMHPVPYDVNGDGILDLVVLDWNTIGHKPGNWEALGAANLFALNPIDGEVIWHVKVPVSWSNKNVAVADFVGSNPGPEILLETTSPGLGLGLHSMQGKRVGFVPLPSGGWVMTRGPAVADVDGDGALEAVVPVARKATGCDRRLDVGCREGALLVYRTAAPADSVVFGNNRLYNAELDTGPAGTAGRMPPPPEPPKPPTPPEPPRNETPPPPEETPPPPPPPPPTRQELGGPATRAPPDEAIPSPGVASLVAVAAASAAALAPWRSTKR